MGPPLSAAASGYINWTGNFNPCLRGRHGNWAWSILHACPISTTCHSVTDVVEYLWWTSARLPWVSCCWEALGMDPGIQSAGTKCSGSPWVQCLIPVTSTISLIFSQHVHHLTEGTTPFNQNMLLCDMSLVQVFHSFLNTKNYKCYETLAAAKMYFTPYTAPLLAPSYSEAFLVCRLRFFCPNSFFSKTWTPFCSGLISLTFITQQTWTSTLGKPIHLSLSPTTSCP